VSLPISTPVRQFIKSRIFVLLITMLTFQSVQAFEIDFSRRRGPASVGEAQAGGKDRSFFQDLLGAPQGQQEVVILLTENGFVPKSVHLRKGQRYTVHVVNVNEKNKNVSFVLDAFSEFHSTFFGKMKSFEITPKQEGVFEFQSPESSLTGRMVILSEPTSGRAPASH
jgi:hypothetical protein